MIDKLTNFGTITTTSADNPSEVKSSVVDLIGACDVKAGPQNARIVLFCTTSSGSPITVKVYGGSATSSGNISSAVTQLTVTPTLALNGKCVIPFPLNHYRYMQIGVTSAANKADAVKAYVEFGA